MRRDVRGAWMLVAAVGFVAASPGRAAGADGSSLPSSRPAVEGEELAVPVPEMVPAPVAAPSSVSAPTSQPLPPPAAARPGLRVGLGSVAQVAVPAALLGMDVVAGGVVAGAGAVSALLALAVWENSYGLDKDPVRSRGLNAAFVGGWVSGVVAPLVAVPVGLVVAVVGALTLYASHGGTLPKLPVGEATEDRPSGRRGREQW